MDIVQLRYLLAVVDAGSLSRAAAQLQVSQPALSQRMTQLERELGVHLLERSPRGVRPTRAGLDFYRDAHRLVRQFDHLAASAADRQEVRGLVAVGIPSGAAVHLAAPLLSWTREHCPGVRLELFESMSGYVAELFDQGRMDLAVVYLAGPPDRSDDVALYAEDLWLVGEPPEPPPADDRIALRDLEGVPIVAPGTRSSLRSTDRAGAARRAGHPQRGGRRGVARDDGADRRERRGVRHPAALVDQRRPPRPGP